MPGQRHAIRRQVLELRVADTATAHRLSSVMAGIVQDRLGPVLEHCLDAASNPARIDRIDRLEIDLGRINPSLLAEELARQLAARLPAAVGKALAARPRPADAPGGEAGAGDAALLLIAHFARTGGLPWWSDARRHDALDAAVDAALAGSLPGLTTLLRRLAADPAAIERLVLHQAEPRLQRLLFLLAPAAAPLPGLLAPLLTAVPAAAALAPARLRQLLWREAFQAARSGPPAPEAWLLAVLTRMAASAGSTLSLLVTDLRAGPAPPPMLAGLLQQIAVPLPAPPVTAAAGLDPLVALDRLVLARPAAAPLLAALRPLLAALNEAARAEAGAALQALLRTDAEAVGHLLGPLLRPFLRAGATDLDTLRPTIAPLQDAATVPPGRTPARPSDAVEDGEARYVENAGLCLLWPFLGRFFGRLGLLAEGDAGFATEPARHRAILLLHHLATGEAEAPEYWLDLNKVLCGLDLAALVLPGTAVTAAEAAEAEDLLGAAIAHAGTLGEISPDGLRGSFLLRRGALSTRDGAWLLRVERQAVDVLLETLPWKTEWLKLPWMPAPLRVEW